MRTPCAASVINHTIPKMRFLVLTVPNPRSSHHPTQRQGRGGDARWPFGHVRVWRDVGHAALGRGCERRGVAAAVAIPGQIANIQGKPRSCGRRPDPSEFCIALRSWWTDTKHSWYIDSWLRGRVRAGNDGPRSFRACSRRSLRQVTPSARNAGSVAGVSRARDPRQHASVSANRPRTAPTAQIGSTP